MSMPRRAESFPPPGGGAISSCEWGRLPDGSVARLYTLRNAQGARIAISDLGAALVSWQTPDRSGRMGDVLLHYDTPRQYLESGTYMGALVGRWANRIAGARFALDGIDYPLDRNEGRNLLHGGLTGFHQALWQAGEESGTLVMRLESPEGDAGFPGNLSVCVRYTFDDDGTLTIRYEAASDAPTPVNLTSHPYFNLSGRPGTDIRGHLLQLDAQAYFEVNDEMIPVRLASVTGSAFDFHQSAPIGARLGWPHAQLALARGFDHCYVLREAPSSPDGRCAVRQVARVYDPCSGRELIVSTDQRGLQLYTGNHLPGAGGYPAHPPYGGLCLEAGAFPNHINMDDAASVVIRPGQVYRQETRYRLGVRD